MLRCQYDIVRQPSFTQLCLCCAVRTCSAHACPPKTSLNSRQPGSSPPSSRSHFTCLVLLFLHQGLHPPTLVSVAASLQQSVRQPSATSVARISSISVRRLPVNQDWRAHSRFFSLLTLVVGIPPPAVSNRGRALKRCYYYSNGYSYCREESRKGGPWGPGPLCWTPFMERASMTAAFAAAACEERLQFCNAQVSSMPP